jgi:hypothetical protein
VEVVVPSEATLGAEAPPPQAAANRATTATKVPSAVKVRTVPLSLALLKSGAPGGR